MSRDRGIDRAPPESLKIGLSDPCQRTPLWLVLQGLTYLAYSVYLDLESYGVRNVPMVGGALIAANHQSFLDPPAVGAPLQRPVSYMAKSELFENPYFGWLIRNLHSFPVRQGKGDRGAILETVRRLQEGHLLNIYSEGSRSEDGEIAPLGGGTALVIRKAQVPLIPTVIDGSFIAWPKGQRLPKPAQVRVLYGPPLKMWHLPPAELTTELERILKIMLQDLRAFPPGGSGEPRSATISPAHPDLVL